MKPKTLKARDVDVSCQIFLQLFNLIKMPDKKVLSDAFILQVEKTTELSRRERFVSLHLLSSVI